MVGVLQTVPSLALLALLIALLGTIGTVPALVALFLYALLPIVVNTHAGMQGVSRGVASEVARALARSDAVAMATLVDSAGSTPKLPGARMFMDARGVVVAG